MKHIRYRLERTKFSDVRARSLENPLTDFATSRGAQLDISATAGAKNVLYARALFGRQVRAGIRGVKEAGIRGGLT